MFCPNCGKSVDENLDLCSECGVGLQVKYENNVNQDINNHCKKKKNIFFIFILIAILFLIFLIIFVKMLSSSDSKNYDDDVVVSIVNDRDSGIPKFIDGKFTNIVVKDDNDAYDVLDTLKDKLKFNNSREEFDIESVLISEDLTHYRFRQKYDNTYVYGTNLIISVDENGNVLSMSGYYIPNINIADNITKSEDDIKQIVEKKLGSNVDILSIDKYIYVDTDSQNLVFIVIGYSDTNVKQYMLDANSGEIMFEIDVVDYATTYSYNGIGLDSKTYTINLEEYFDLTGGAKNRYRFYDPERKISIADYRNTGPIFSSLVTLMPGTTPIVVDIKDGKIDMTWEDEEFIQNAVTTMYNYEKIYDYYKNVLGRDSYDDKGSKIIVNLGITSSTFSNDDLNNAFWSSLTNQMYIGNFNGKSFSVSLDVLAHEFTHGVIANTSKFVNTPKDKNKAFETGALNEAYSDILGSLIEGKNWTIGESNEILRSLSNPKSFKTASVKGGEYYFPDGYLSENRTLEQFLIDNNLKKISDYDNGGIHQNSTVVGYTAYLMYENGAFKSREEMARVWYNSLFLLSSYSNFEDCALAVIKSAKNLGLSNKSIKIIEDAFIETKILERNSDNFSVSGYVTSGYDKLPGVKVVIRNDIDATSYERTSDAEGAFGFNDLQPGMYTVTVDVSGYKLFTKSIEINDKDVNIILDLEEITQDVENDYYMKVDGVKYELDTKCYAALISNGWYLGEESQSDTTIKGKSYEYYSSAGVKKFNFYNDKYKYLDYFSEEHSTGILSVDITTYTENDVEINDGICVEISYLAFSNSLVNEENLYGEIPEIEIKGGITIGNSSSDVKKVFGEPDKIYGYQYLYGTLSNYSIDDNYSFTFDDDFLYAIGVKDFKKWYLSR